MHGLVIKNTGSWYQVKTDDGKLVDCKIKGNFRLKGIRSTNPIAVGDYVQIIVNNEGTAFISEIEDRKNYIIRRASNLSKQSHILAANLDQCMLIITINYPETSTVFIDRFLATAEAYRVELDDMKKPYARLSYLKGAIKGLGVINVNAVEEFKATKERYDFLTTQVDDLNKTKKSLNDAIAAKLCSPPESREMLLTLFPGGRIVISIPLSSGCSGS